MIKGGRESGSFFLDSTPEPAFRPLAHRKLELKRKLTVYA